MKIKILDYLKISPAKSRKSILSAIYVLKNDPVFRQKMIEGCKIVNNDYRNQKKDEKEKFNWIKYSMNEI